MGSIKSENPELGEGHFSFVVMPTSKVPTRRESGHLLSSSGCWNWGLDRGSWDSSVAVRLGLAAIAGDVASLATAIAGLASSVERAAVGCSAVTGNMAQFATGVTLHCLSLAISGEVVWSTALVAGSRTRATSKGAPSGKSTKSATGRTGSSTSHASSGAGIGAVAGQVASQTTAIASSAGSSSAQAQSRAISLWLSDMRPWKPHSQNIPGRVRGPGSDNTASSR